MPQNVIWVGTGALLEQANSPQFEFGETGRATQVFKGNYDLALASAPRKGALGLGLFAGMKVSGSTVTREKGGVGTLTIVFEGAAIMGGDELNIPPDEVEVDYGQSSLDIKKLPQYSGLTSQDFWGVDAYLNSSTFQTLEFFDWLTEGPNGDKIESLLIKLQRGETEKLIYPPVVRWTSYFLDEPQTSGGGYIETPTAPINFPAGWSWLRAGDQLSFSGTFWKLTSTWLSSEQWDPDLYP